MRVAAIQRPKITVQMEPTIMIKLNDFQPLKTTVLLALAFSLVSNPAYAANPEIKIGGAVRLNYSWKDYDKDSNGKFEVELYRIDVDVSQDEWFFDGQFRWYPGFSSIHHAEVGYRLDENNVITIGVTQVPFGMEPYSSNSFWFSGAYYVGLEDDYDTGITWQNNNGNWSTDLAYFFNAEYDDGARFERYSFDIASTSERANREDGQSNARIQYREGDHTLGASFQFGQFVNSHSLDKGDHWAIGVHYFGQFSNWAVRAQLMRYNYETQPSLGTADHRIALSAFEFPFDIAAKATLSTFNLARTFNFNTNYTDSVTCYNEYTHISPYDQSGFADSVQNVTGCNIVKGGLYAYIDWISGKNMWFIGGPGVGIEMGPVKWRSRLNINIGLYF